MNDSTTTTTLTEEERLGIEVKIIHLLGIYPVISPTMLQGGLGPSVKPALWRPILMDLIDRGVVIEESESRQTPTDRYNSYAKLYLAEDHVKHTD